MNIRPEFINAIWGGLLISLSVSIFLLFVGRVTGISGIINGVLLPKKNDLDWRITFVLGLMSGGFLMHSIHPEYFVNTSNIPIYYLVFAGLFVGFGAIMANGCTSGHGICGISRFSIRSLVATLVFTVAGALTILLRRIFL